MNKILKTILIISVVFLASFSLIQPTQAVGQTDLMVFVCKTENNPLDCTLLDDNNHTSLFGESDFLPGETINRWIKVTNLSSDVQQIGINVTGHSSVCPSSNDVLADVLTLIIEEDANQLYQDSLTNFYSSGEKYLSEISSGAVNIYKFSAFFASESGNDYQGCSTNFDFEVGFWGESISSEVNTPAGGSGSGVIIAGLEITNENASLIQTTTATITWLTNKLATSRVIWGADNESLSFDWKNPPDYGYPHSTAEDLTKEINHSILISSLLPDTTYYYRCISHASPDTVSREYSFTTLGPEMSNQEGKKEIIGDEMTKKEIPINVIETGGIAIENKEVKDSEEKIAEEGKEARDSKTSEEESISVFNSLLASIGNLFNLKNLCLIVFILVIILVILFLLFLKKKHRKME